MDVPCDRNDAYEPSAYHFIIKLKILYKNVDIINIDSMSKVHERRLTIMNIALQITQLIYNISFIVFTFILVIYAIKTYNNEKKQPYKLLARINYSFVSENDNENSVKLDILNYGDYPAKMVKILLIVNREHPIELDYINYIAPQENFEYYVGKRIDNKLILFSGQEYTLVNPLDYDYFNETTNENIVTLSIRVTKG